jgi:hypothetical protein
MGLREEVEAAHGVAIAQTALVSALIGVLRQQGVLTPDLVNVTMDAALTQVETAASIDPELAMRARRVLELIAAELQGQPKDQV